MARKRRTRQHVIADLSINHVERHALLAACAVDRTQADYGIDLYIYTYDANGEIENGHISVQVKATDRVHLLADGKTIAFRLKRGDIDRWLGELLPVLLVLYDATQEIAYWIEVQSYFAQRSVAIVGGRSTTVTVHLPLVNRIDAKTFRQFAIQKSRLLRRVAT